MSGQVNEQVHGPSDSGKSRLTSGQGSENHRPGHFRGAEPGPGSLCKVQVEGPPRRQIQGVGAGQATLPQYGRHPRVTTQEAAESPG